MWDESNHKFGDHLLWDYFFVWIIISQLYCKWKLWKVIKHRKVVVIASLIKHVDANYHAMKGVIFEM